MGKWHAEGEKGQRTGFVSSPVLLAVAVVTILVVIGSMVVWATSTDHSKRRTIKVPYALGAPRLIQRPANPTVSTSASFTFGSTLPQSTFHCRLDVREVARCSSAAVSKLSRGDVTYTGLPRGRHCFFVFTSSMLGTSPTTAYCWTIAGPPATLRIVTGSAQSTVVNSTFGSRFSLRILDSSGVPVPGLRVAFSARTPDAGSRTPLVAVRGAALHPRVVLLSALHAPVASTAASPTMPETPLMTTAAVPSGTFARCGGGNPTPSSCVTASGRNGVAVSSIFTANSVPGSYVVYATIDSGGPGLVVRFLVTNLPASSANSSATTTTTTLPVGHFAIAGDLSVPFAPGVTQSINLIITNPFGVPITIHSGAITTLITSNTPACPAGDNFAVTQGLTTSVTIPANQSRSLSSLSVPQGAWPKIEMLDTSFNQDGCKGATLTLSYGGTAQG